MYNHTIFSGQRGRVLRASGGLVLLLSLPGFGAVFNWNGGSGDWNTSSSNWNGSGTVWPAAGADNDAVFGATAGTVTVTSGGVTVNDITFNTTGYNIGGGALTLNGTSPTLSVSPATTASISSSISGSAGVVKDGSGVLALTGAGTWTGATAIRGGSLQFNGGTFNTTDGITVGTASPTAGTLRVSAGVVRAVSVTVLGGGSVINLEGGTLKTDSVNLGGTGSFLWGAGTLTHYTPNGSTASPDYTIPTLPFGETPVYSGTVLNFTGNLASSDGSTLDLGSSHLSGGVRFNRLLVSGNIDLTGSTLDVLKLSFNPYFLRPFSYFPNVDYGSIPLVTATGSFTGQFDILNIQTSFGNTLPFTFAGVNVVTDAASLAADTWALEYDTAESTLWLHYKVNPTIPEPATAGLIFLSVASARIATKLRRRKLHKDGDAGRFDDETRADGSEPAGWFDSSSKL